MTDIRKNRGKGSNYGEAWHSSPFGSKLKSVEHVHIDEIYPNGKPKRNKDLK